MRLKTFIATYLLFLVVLFSSVGIVSFYLNNSQISMLQDKSGAQFQTIVSSLDRDIGVLWSRDGGRGLTDSAFYDAVDTIVRGYARYYDRHNINIDLTDTRLTRSDDPISEIEFVSNDAGYFIVISEFLTEPFDYFILNYRLDITESITEMRGIQTTLLVSIIAFSAVAAVLLYLVLSSIFRPLTVVARASRQIAGGRFSERIPIKSKSKNELAQVAVDFNKMAERIERQIILLEEEAENKQQFVDNFAHEMRTPLTSIYGYAEYMQKALLKEGEITELSGRIMNRAGYLQEIANSLLQLAMLRDYTPNKAAISIAELFKELHKTFYILFDCQIDTETVNGQEDLLKILLTNLCTNSIRAGATQIYLKAIEKNACVTLIVADNGCGISADSLAKVTEPFYRVDKSRNRKDGGAGLGLALCRRIAEAHGAEMTIVSEVGVGTEVKITFTTS